MPYFYFLIRATLPMDSDPSQVLDHENHNSEENEQSDAGRPVRRHSLSDTEADGNDLSSRAETLAIGSPRHRTQSDSQHQYSQASSK